MHGLAIYNVNSQTSAGPASNLLNDRLGRAWQIATAGGYVETVFGIPPSIDTIALLAGSATTGDTWRVRCAFSQANLTASPTYDSGNIAFLASADGASRVHRQSLLHLASPVTAPWWRIDVTSATTGLTFGRLVIGKSFKPAENIDFGWDMAPLDRGSIDTSGLGITDARIAAKTMQYRFAWAYLTEAEARGAALELSLYAGKTRPVLFCGDYAATDKHNLIGYGRLQEGARFNNFMFNGYASAFGIESDLIFTI